jgi:uncharacterized membrane protein
MVTLFCENVAKGANSKKAPVRETDDKEGEAPNARLARVTSSGAFPQRRMRTMLYLTLKWLHVLLAVVAIGTNLTYSVWLIRAARAPQPPELLAFTLRGIKILDDRIANPAYALLLVTGLATAFVGTLPITTPWILVSLVLFVALVVLGLFGYTPTLRRQIELVENGSRESAEYAAVFRRGIVLGIALGVVAVTIVFLMVIKPSLWT